MMLSYPRPFGSDTVTFLCYETLPMEPFAKHSKPDSVTHPCRRKHP
jgi:hypothetical protein